MGRPQREAITPELPAWGLCTLDDCSETSTSDSGYTMSNLKFKGLYGSPDQTKLWLYLPEWWHSDFVGAKKKAALAQQKGYQIVYQSNIMSPGTDTTLVQNPSILEAICGQFEGEVIDYLWDSMSSVCSAKGWEVKQASGVLNAELTDVIRKFIETYSKQIDIGYIRKQRRNKETKALEPGYNVDSLFIPTKEKLEYLQAASNPEGFTNAKGKRFEQKYECLVDEEIPF